MYYGNIKNCDISNGEGVRISLFVSGCTNHCRGCFQPETWDFKYGSPFTPKVQDDILNMLAPSYIDGLTVLGGEPFEPSNQHSLLPFLELVRGTYPDKTIWMYTGFSYEDLITPGAHPHTALTSKILSLIDVLVDGPFDIDQSDISLRFRGSRNQRIIDVPPTLKQGHIVFYDEVAHHPWMTQHSHF